MLRRCVTLLAMTLLLGGLTWTPPVDADAKTRPGGGDDDDDGGSKGKGGGGSKGDDDDYDLGDLFKDKPGGIGFGLRPGLIPPFSTATGAGSGENLAFAIGARGLFTIADYTRAGGEVYYDLARNTLDVGGNVEGAIPIRKRLDVGIGGGVGYAGVIEDKASALYLEPRVTIHYARGSVCIEGSLSYQFHVLNSEGTTDTGGHHGVTYLTFSMLFGQWS